MNKFNEGDHVVVRSPGHARNGEYGIVAYIGHFGTIGVYLLGQRYGFMPSELIHASEA